MADSRPSHPPLDWVIRISLPFSWAASKNAVWAHNSKGHIWSRGRSREYRTAITVLVQLALKGITVRQAKLWIDIFVQKPNHHGDAVNVVDLVCDAVKDAVGVDDRWFCIRGVDWQIAKTDPHLIIGIGQEDTPDLQACSSCGRLLTFEHFSKHRSNKNGLARNCRQCISDANRIRKSGALVTITRYDDDGPLFQRNGARA